MEKQDYIFWGIWLILAGGIEIITETTGYITLGIASAFLIIGFLKKRSVKK